MSADSLSGKLNGAKVNRVDGLPGKADRMVKKVDRGVPMELAKVRVGAAMKRAMEGRALKEFGDAGQISNVHSGEKVPDYFARIYMDPSARRRFALALLEDDDRCEIETIVRMRA